MNLSQTEPAASVSQVRRSASSDRGEPLAVEGARLIRQFSDGMLAGLRQYLVRTRESRDWQDRIHMLDLVVPAIPLDVLETACAIDAYDASLATVRCAYYSALDYRNSGPFSDPADPRVRKAAECIRIATTALETATALDPADPTSLASIVSALGIFAQLKPVLEHVIDQATAIAPDLSTLLAARRQSPTRPN